MSVWAHRKTFHAWDPDYQPEHKTGEVWIHAAPGFNDCIRLDACENPLLAGAHVGSVMLDREMAAELAEYLMAFAMTGVAEYEGDAPGQTAQSLAATARISASAVRST